jgi:hypothetical protein
MMAITTSSSINVKARPAGGDGLNLDLIITNVWIFASYTLTCFDGPGARVIQ